MGRHASAIWKGVWLFFFTSCAGCAFAPAHFVVTNGTDQPIPYLTVEVHDRWFVFRDIPPGGTARGWFRVNHEATLLVSGHFADGTEFGEPCGYVTWADPAPCVRVLIRAHEPWIVQSR
jgi:hypothetical protein